MQFYFRHGSALNTCDNANVQIGKSGSSGHMSRLENCLRCGGAGGSEAWKFTGWTCYRCGGKCKETRTHRVFTAEKLLKLNNAAQVRQMKDEARRSAKLEQRRQEFITWARPHGKLIGAILTTSGNSFLKDLTEKLHAHWTLSERQMEAATNDIQRTVDREVQDAASDYVGDLKERLDFEAVVEFTKIFETIYGDSTLIKLRDVKGNVFTWFASGIHDIGRGDRLSIRGMVKEHRVYRGVKQTVINRCKYTKFNIMTADEAVNAEVLA